MKVLTNTIAGALAGALVAGAVVGILALVQDPIVIPDAIKGETGATGPRGAQGVAGPVGPVGPVGSVGPAGKDGKDATYNLTELARKVQDEIERLEERTNITLNGNNGTSVRTVAITEAGSYEIESTHFGAEAFIASLEKPNGGLISLVNSTGHVDADTTVILSTGTYKLHVTASGDWTVKVQEN